MTYMVLENHLSYSVVLDEAGRFLQVANLGYEIGQSVDRVVEIEQKQKSNVIPLRLIGIAGTIAACFVLVFSFYLNNLSAPFASIYMSINPAIRIDVKQDGRVVGLSSVNDDGARLIGGYEWKQKDMTLVTDELVGRAIDMGFLSSGGTVSVNIDSPDELWFQETGVAIRQNLNEYLSERVSVTIEVGHHDDAHGPDSAPSSVTPPTTPPSIVMPSDRHSEDKDSDDNNDNGKDENDKDENDKDKDDGDEKDNHDSGDNEKDDNDRDEHDDDKDEDDDEDGDDEKDD